MIVDQNDLCRKYDYSSLITDNETDTAISVIKSIIESGKYFKNSPLFQTEENLFARNEAVWLKYRMTFLTSVFLYLGHEARVSNMMAWSFMTNKHTQPDRDTLWHHHDKHGGQGISGIMYLHIPNDVEDLDTCGTEMSLDGPNGKQKFFVRPTYYSWLIYPSHIWHRPGVAQSDDYRFILAADVQYS